MSYTYVSVLPVTICTLGIGIHRAANLPTVADCQVGLWQSKSSVINLVDCRCRMVCLEGFKQ